MRKENFAIMFLAATFIVAGFVLMRPPVDVKAEPNGHFAHAPGPGAMEGRRIRVAPALCLTGYVLMLPAILYVPKHKK